MPKTVLRDARRALADFGLYIMNQTELSRCLRIVDDEWDTLARHWDDLVPDPYVDEAGGTTRLRRYGEFGLTGSGPAVALPHRDFVPPPGSGSRYAGRPRSFAPLTDGFIGEPLFGRFLGMLGWLAGGLEDPDRWIVHVHPLRVLAEGAGEPTSAGMHRDGVTLVASLLIRRCNALGGQSTVTSSDGEPVLTTTLVEPGTLVLSDDRRTLHGVSPIRAAVVGQPALRDVLVVTLAPG